MKKITLFLIVLSFMLTANAQYVFNPITGPVNVAEGTPVTLNINDITNTAGVTASSTGSYDSFLISADWEAGGGNPWSNEADVTITTTAGSITIDPATTGSAGSGTATTLTFEGNLPTIYDPNIDGYIDLVLNQSFDQSNADWSNITVTLFESPACLVPTGMTSLNATTTSLDLTWNAGATETVWNIEWNASADFTPGTGAEEGSSIVNTTPSLSLTALTPDTSYYLYYQADCAGDSLSEWVGPFIFLTSYCDSIPTSNDGDGITDVSLGNEIFTSAGDVTYEDFTSPVVDLTAGITANMQITFATGFTYDVNLWVDLNNDLVYDNATELVFQGETTNANPTIFDASFLMPNVPLGMYNMRMGSADSGQASPNACYSGSWGVTADFIVNVTAPPECIPASALTATNIMETSAELSWNDGGTGVTWDLEWGTAGFMPGTGTIVAGLTSTIHILNNLIAGTAYDFYVTVNCATSTSTISETSTFVTAISGETCANAFSMTVEPDCSTAVPIVFDFGNAADIDANNENPSCDGSGNFGHWLTFTAPATGSVLFHFDGAADSIGLEILDACGGNTIGTCENNSFDAGDNSGLISGLISGNTYVAVIWRDQQSGTADVCIEAGPTCPFPINLTTANITGNSVDLSWTENGMATVWNLEWGPAGFMPGTGTLITGLTTTQYSLAGLTFSTDYDFYVQADCGTETSDLSNPETFTTTPQFSFSVDCNVGPLTIDYCYSNNIDDNPSLETFTFTSSNGTPLNLVFNSGIIENNWDELVVLDSDGTPFLGYEPGPLGFGNGNFGNAGNVSGLTFQSSGDTISYYINSDGSVSCQSGSPGEVDGINFTVACATCINPQVTYTVIDDCNNGDQFLIDLDVTNLGDATSLTISNNINTNTIPVAATGVYQIGPFPFLVDVVVTVSNNQDVNCIINSQAIQLMACPPDNDNCNSAFTAIVNDNNLCNEITSGTILAATLSSVPPNSCTGDTDDDVWFQFTALDEIEFISLINIQGGTTNLDHAVYEGTCDNLMELYCSSDSSSLTPSLTIGNTYYIRVFSGGSDNETSTFDLCIREAPTNTICENAENFCSVGEVLVGPNIVGLSDSSDVACLGSVPNPSWNIIQIGESGLIEIEIIQWEDDNNNGIQDLGESGLDVDFVIWGPFTSVEDSCDNIDLVDCPTCQNNTINPDFYPFGNIIDCSYSSAAIENLTIDNAMAGEIYMLLITNFSDDAGSISIEQTNIGDSGGGNIIAEIDVEITSNDVIFEDTGNDAGQYDIFEGSVCGFDSVTITANSPLADSFAWFEDGFLMPGETGPSITVTESNNYQVQATDTNCESVAFSQIVIINIYDDPGMVSPQNITVCDGLENDGSETFDLDALTTSLGFGTDFTVSYYTNTSDANQTLNPVASPYTSSGETLIIRVEDTDAANNNYLGCRVLSEVELIVNPIPVIGIPDDLEVCSSTGFATFNLTDNDATVLNGLDPADYNVTYHISQSDADAKINAITSANSAGETIYVNVEEVSPQGCYNVSDFELIILDEAVASIETNVFYYDENTNEFLLCLQTETDIQLTLVPENFSLSDVTIQWQLDGIAISGENGISINANVAGEYTAVITLNSTGCSFVLENIMLVEIDNCEIPQGISPGVSPGQNDTFDLRYYNVSSLEIFNRNGTRVYSKTNYTNEWVGQTNDGEELPVGTYFYTMIYEGGAKKRTGWIYINK